MGRARAPRDQEWVTWVRTDTPSPLPSSLWHASHESTVSHPQKPSSPAEVQKMVSCVCFVVAVLFLFLKKKIVPFSSLTSRQNSGHSESKRTQEPVSAPEHQLKSVVSLYFLMFLFPDQLCLNDTIVTSHPRKQEHVKEKGSILILKHTSQCNMFLSIFTLRSKAVLTCSSSVEVIS